ncbi:hypothetical protein A8B75_13490 [Sphingomonadales bacterium EhC05]|nr:hypothetical protein A8B75_13490 [Sphingomonadales bacterium EhC05]
MLDFLFVLTAPLELAVGETEPEEPFFGFLVITIDITNPQEQRVYVQRFKMIKDLDPQSADRSIWPKPSDRPSPEVLLRVSYTDH